MGIFFSTNADEMSVYIHVRRHPCLRSLLINSESCMKLVGLAKNS